MSNYSCRICRSEYRFDIEAMLTKKMQYRNIARQFKPHFACDLHLLEQSIGVHHKKHVRKVKDLSPQEVSFLRRLQSGEVDLEEASREVAVRVFENILRNPHDVRFIDFFRAEELRIRQKENQIKNQWSKEIIARLFANKLPPPYCPHCGKATNKDENEIGVNS